MEWIKKHKFSIVGFFLLSIVGVPIIIHCSFKASSSWDFFVAEWSAGELLGYCGTVLGSLSTTVLSILALWQTNQIKKESDYQRKQIERLEQRRAAPTFIMKHNDSINYGQNMKIDLKNNSENIANELILEKVSLMRNKEIVWQDGSMHFGVILPQSSITMIFQNPNLHQGDRMNFIITCTDIYENKIEYVYTSTYSKQSNNIEFYLCKIVYK